MLFVAMLLAASWTCVCAYQLARPKFDPDDKYRWQRNLVFGLVSMHVVTFVSLYDPSRLAFLYQLRGITPP